MISGAETVKRFRSKFGLPDAVENCLASAMTAAYYVAFKEPELFGAMEFWKVAAPGANQPHVYIAAPIDGQIQVLNKGVTWPDDKYPDYDYDSLCRNGVPVDRAPIDLFVKSALEGGAEMKRLVDLITKPEKLLEFEENL